jgi:hypothetical protein
VLVQTQGHACAPIKARTREALDDALVHTIDIITATDAQGWFIHCGYAVYQIEIHYKSKLMLVLKFNVIRLFENRYFANKLSENRYFANKLLDHLIICLINRQKRL